MKKILVILSIIFCLLMISMPCVEASKTVENYGYISTVNGGIKERSNKSLDGWDWCTEETKNIISIVKLAIKIIQWIVPIGMIIMTTIDVFKQVINPETQDGIKKIGKRVISAIIIFLVPLIVDLVIELVNVGDTKSGAGWWSCWGSTSAKSELPTVNPGDIIPKK